MAESGNIEQQRRIWELRLHFNQNFYNRLNFFLVFESVLLGVVGLLYSKPQPPVLILKMMVLPALCLTIIWGYVQSRQKHFIDDLDEQIICFAPEYKAHLERRRPQRWYISSKWLLTYMTPGLVILIWLAFLFFI